MNLVAKATKFATAKHAGQERKYTGEPYVNHLLAVAELVTSTVGPRDEVIAAAILHDVLEDTETTVAELKREFGPEVTGLVVELTDVYLPGTGGNRKVRKAKERERLAAVSADAQTIKVADVIDNTKSIWKRDPGFAKVYLTEKRELLRVLTKADPRMLARAKKRRA